MKIQVTGVGLCLLLSLALGTAADEEGLKAKGAAKLGVPDVLLPWVDWARHGLPAESVPRVHNEAEARMAVWPGLLRLSAGERGGEFAMDVRAFADGWLVLPGEAEHWPAAVRVGSEVVPVAGLAGRPAVRISPGEHRVSGRFEWETMPQRLAVPAEVGKLELRVGDDERVVPVLDGEGRVWLDSGRGEEPEGEDSLAVMVNSLLEDGVPMWFESRVEMVVGGRARDVEVGAVLPVGWRLAGVEAAIPVSVDDKGVLRARLRPGRWVVVVRAFQTKAEEEVAFAEGVEVAVPWQTVAFRGDPQRRQVELEGMPGVDASQVAVPAEWRSLPNFRWETGEGFTVRERVRGGAGVRGSELTLRRTLWLDDDGCGLTFRDVFSGPLNEIRRFDVVAGHELGSVDVGGASQLITRNPDTGASGFEARVAELEATAVGRVARVEGEGLAAAGWQAGFEQVSGVLNLPPGWRLFAMGGVDRSNGDWLTSWDLLDLFLLLVFTLAVFRLRGVMAACLAFAAFGVIRHEALAPNATWFLLLGAVAMAGVVRTGWGGRIARGVKWTAVVVLLIYLVPFAGERMQAALYPQLESRTAWSGGPLPILSGERAMAYDSMKSPAEGRQVPQIWDNLGVDPDAVVQTGPGVPDWEWRRVEFGWDGPVSAGQEVRMFLVSPVVSRLWALACVLLPFALTGVLVLDRRRRGINEEDGAGGSSRSKGAVAAGVLGCLVLGAAPGHAEGMPDGALLAELRQRLATPEEVFPNVAEVAEVVLDVRERQVSMAVEIHAQARAAVPFPDAPGVWSVETVEDAGGEHAVVARRGGRLWVLVPERGIHRFRMTGTLRDVAAWEWDFELKPRRARVQAEGWDVSGVRADGRLENQVLFTRVRRQEGSVADFGGQDVGHAFVVEREVELGLQWRVRTIVRRVSPAGRATAVDVALLPGERVTTAGLEVAGGVVSARFGVEDEVVAWEGELQIGGELAFVASEAEGLAERWRLQVSPVWTLHTAGLEPAVEVLDGGLAAVWRPWPGEKAEVNVGRPEAVSGATVTVDRVTHEVNPGRRHRASTIAIHVRSSIGGDFPIGLPPLAEVVSVELDGEGVPLRMEGDAVVVRLRPGAQKVELAWRMDGDLKGWSRADSVVLPVEAANVTTRIRVPSHRWVWRTDGPQRGPAVRFAAVLVFALVLALVLSRIPESPAGFPVWALLAVGLTQVHVLLAAVLVGWLFFVRWRGSDGFQTLPSALYNLCQLALIVLTMAALGVFVAIAATGLLGEPEMFIAGNGSRRSLLDWFEARSEANLPNPGFWSVSVWWYRLAMLLWALWLAVALIRWLCEGWRHSSRGGHFRGPNRRPKTLPAADEAEERNGGTSIAGPPPIPGGEK